MKLPLFNFIPESKRQDPGELNTSFSLPMSTFQNPGLGNETAYAQLCDLFSLQF